MNRYTIFCTPEQTKKALKLGAPISIVKSIRTKETILSSDVIEYDDKTFTYVVTPTAEQMIGWLEEQKFFKQITVLNISLENQQDKWIGFIYFTDDDKNLISVGFYNSRKEATLAAIDVALEYLEQRKE